VYLISPECRSDNRLNDKHVCFSFCRQGQGRNIINYTRPFNLETTPAAVESKPISDRRMQRCDDPYTGSPRQREEGSRKTIFLEKIRNLAPPETPVFEEKIRQFD